MIQGRFKSSRQTWMLVGLIAAFNFLLVGLSAHHLLGFARETRANAQTQTRNIASALESSLSSNLEKSFLALHAVALDYERSLSSGGDRSGVERTIEKLLAEIPFLESIRVTDASGAVILGVKPGVKAFAGDRDYFVALRDDPALRYTVSAPVVGRINNRWTIFLATRHTRPDGSFGGVVLAGVPLDNLVALFSSIDLGTEGVVSLRGADLGLVARWPNSGGVAQGIGAKNVSPEFRRILDANLSEETYVGRTGSDGVERIQSYRRVRAFPLHLIVGVSTEELGRRIRSEGMAFALLLPLVALFSGVLLYAWLRREARRVSLNEELAQSERRFRAIFNEVKDGIIVAEVASRRFVMVNDTICRMLGYTREELIGRTVADLHPSSRTGEILALFDRHARVGGLPVVPMPLRRKDGTVFRAEVNATTATLGGEMCLIGIFRDVSAKLRAEEELERIFKLSLDLLAVADTGGHFRKLNPAWEATLGYPLAELENAFFLDFVHPDDREATVQATAALAEGREVIDFTNRYRRADGVYRYIEWRSAPFQGNLIYAAARDVTERREAAAQREKLEGELRHAQKMEAVGRLAGGIAHDFNNLLTAILGYCALLNLEEPLTAKGRRNLEQIQAASERAASLTRQLLAYSRKQILQPRILNPAATLSEIEKMLARLLGEDVILTLDAAQDTGFISADPDQLGQVLLNLAINARDALPHGGRLTISTANVRVATQERSAALGVPMGSYVALTVEDDGTGMDGETLSHIFEPFFTTKEVGKGTGLGLATVQGIVLQSGGHVRVESEPGRGTTFRLYFPRVEEAGAQGAEGGAPIPGELPGGSETILLAEDSAQVRNLAMNILTMLGYRVLVAESGEEALRLAVGVERIDLLLTDMVMPGMNGRALAERLVETHPEARVLYMSGYTEGEIVEDGVLKEGLDFLQKPFRVAEVAARVREALDAGAR